MVDLAFNILREFHNFKAEDRKEAISKIEDIIKSEIKFYKQKKNMNRTFVLLGLIVVIMQCFSFDGTTRPLRGLDVFSISLLVVIIYNSLQELAVELPAQKREIETAEGILKSMKRMDEKLAECENKENETETEEE